VNFLARRAIARAVRGRPDLIPKDATVGAEGFFVHDLIGNCDEDGDGRAESFRLAVTNAWFDQRITSVALALNGRMVPEGRTFLRVDGRVLPARDVLAVEYRAGEPVEVIARGRALGRGMHFAELFLGLELESFYSPVPIGIAGGRARVLLFDDDLADLTYPPPAGGARVHFVPHVHYDVEWLETADVFERVGARNLLEVLRLLREHPEYTFALDQAPQLRAFARSHPDRFAELADFVRAGRVEITNGLWAEPDTNLVSGESLVMGSVLFQRYAAETFGKTCPVGWLIDSFGMSAQLPQIFAKSGSEALMFSRVLDEQTEPDFRAEFLWEGIDGSRLPCHYFPWMYYAGYPMPDDPRRAMKRMARLTEAMRAHAAGADLLVPAGIDHGRPQESPLTHLPAWNAAHPDVPWTFSLPARYVAAVRRSDLPVRRGEFQRVFAGVWSARPRIKLANREAETRIQEAEALATLAHVNGLPYPHDALTGAWEALLENQFHDRIASGVTDAVARGVEARSEAVIAACAGVARAATDHLLARLAKDPAPGGAPSVRFAAINALAFERSEWIEVDLPDAAELDSAVLLAPEGPIEFQVLDRRDYGDGRMKSLRLGFVARLPAMGYRVFRFAVAPDVVRPVPGAIEVLGDTVKGGVWRVDVDSRKGTIRRIAAAEGPLRFPVGEAGALVLERDRGNLMTTLVPARGGRKAERALRVAWTERGPLRAVLRTEGVVGASRFEREWRFHRDLPRIDARVAIDYRDPGHRLRVRLGTGVRVKSWTHEVPYGAMERPFHELPALRWADASGAGKGMTILNHGIAGHELTGGSAYLSLLRSQDKIHFFDAGPGGFALGDHAFRFALVPHAGDWRAADAPRRGQAFALPPRVAVVGETSGTWGPARSLLSVEPSAVDVTALRVLPAGGIEMRLVETAGAPASAVLRFGFPVRDAEVTDLLGRPLASLRVRDKVLSIALGAFEILTLRLGG
jgi:alpha-mannosidase